jgi:hypothetical protein
MMLLDVPWLVLTALFALETTILDVLCIATQSWVLVLLATLNMLHELIASRLADISLPMVLICPCLSLETAFNVEFTMQVLLVILIQLFTVLMLAQPEEVLAVLYVSITATR